MQERQGRISRRQFLRGLGVTGAAVSVPGFLAACGNGDDVDVGATGDGGTTGGGPASPAATSAGTGTSTGGGSGEALKLGLMVPLSGTYAALGQDMINGLELYLAQNDDAIGGRPVELVTVETEANPEVGLGAARRLIEEDQVDIATGIVSSAVALGVRDLFHESQVPLVVSNAGANDVTRAAVSPYIFRSSFSNWQPCFSIGEWAVDNVDAGDGFFIIAPDYAAGQEDAVAFREAYELNGGGTVIGETFPPFGTTQDYQPFISEIQQSGAGAVFAFFAGGEAINFVQQYANFGLRGELPLIGPGFLTDDGILNEIGESALGLQTSLHYTPFIDSPENQEHVAAYTETYDVTPTCYSVASYDVGTLIAAALEATGGETSDVDAFVEAMANVGTVPSPRGEWEMDPVSHNPVQTFYLREVQEIDGALGNAVVEDLGVYADPGPEGA